MCISIRSPIYHFLTIIHWPLCTHLADLNCATFLLELEEAWLVFCGFNMTESGVCATLHYPIVTKVSCTIVLIQVNNNYHLTLMLLHSKDILLMIYYSVIILFLCLPSKYQESFFFFFFSLLEIVIKFII